MTPTPQDSRPREAEAALRRWCPEAETHQDADDPVCAWADHARHRLRLRCMLICSVCGMGSFTRKELEKHECFGAY